MIFGTRKVVSLGYRTVKKNAEKLNRLSRVHQRHRQTTDGRPIAYSERNVVRSLKTAYRYGIRRRHFVETEEYTNDLHEALMKNNRKKQGNLFRKCWDGKLGTNK